MNSAKLDMMDLERLMQHSNTKIFKEETLLNCTVIVTLILDTLEKGRTSFSKKKRKKKTFAHLTPPSN